MNITCNIIKDLLPLYADDMVSEDSKALIEDHLCTCDSCANELENLKKMPRIPAEVDISSLRRVENTIQRKKKLTVATALLTLVAVLVTGVIFFMTPVYLTAEQAVEGVQLREDGGLAIDYSSGIMRHGSTDLGTENEEFHWCHTTRYDWLRSKLFGQKLSDMNQEALANYIQLNTRKGETYEEARDRILNIRVEYGTYRIPDGYVPGEKEPDPSQWELISRSSDKNVWYVNPYNPKSNTLIWSGAQMDTEGIPYGITGVYLGLFGSCVLLAAVLLPVTRKREGRVWELLRCVALLAVGTAASTLLVTGGALLVTWSTASYKWPKMILCESVIVTLTLLMWRKLRLVNQTE